MQEHSHMNQEVTHTLSAGVNSDVVAVSLVSIILVIAAGIQIWTWLHRRKPQPSTMSRMLIAMTSTMMLSLNAGTAVGILSQNMFDSSLISVGMGLVTAWFLAYRLSSLALLDSMMSAIMGGMMGAMLGVMVNPEQQVAALIFLGLLTIGIQGLIYRCYKSQLEGEVHP